MQVTQRTPRPTRSRAYLVSEGFPEPTYTHHTYVRTELHPCRENGELHPEYRFVFRCNNTGAERVFGCEDATRITQLLQNNENTGLPS